MKEELLNHRLLRVPPTLSLYLMLFALLLVVVATGCDVQAYPLRHNLVPATETIPTSNAITEPAVDELRSEYPCISEEYVQTGYVTKIVDGDTILAVIDGQEYRIRYIGMNAPEVGDPGADEATSLNALLAYHKEVELYRDVSETDKYGRLLRYVVVDGVFVNYELVIQGAAKSGYWEPDTACRTTLEEAELDAQFSGVGIWRSD